MSFSGLTCSPFANLPLTSCQSNRPEACCLRAHPEPSTNIEMNQKSGSIRLSYESGAMAIVNEEFQIIRSSCKMLWFRDRNEVMHVLD